MTPENLDPWVAIIRDVVIVACGGFMLIFEVFVRSPNPYLIGAGLTLLGVPPALRLDRHRGKAPEPSDPDA